MRKPELRWQTRRHVAVLDPATPGGTAHDERFVLRPVAGEGRPGRAWFRRSEQLVDARVADDPDVPHAARCWLAARGCFELSLRTEDGHVLHEGPFDVESLGDPLPSAPASTLVTLAPSNAELVDALGAFDRVLACEDSTDHPPAAAGLPRLGPDLGPDLDRVAALRPELVVSSLSVPGMERIVTGLRARAIPQVVLAPRSVADVLEDLRRVGARLGLGGRAEEVVARMQAEVAALRRGQPREPVRIYLEWWPRPMFSPGRDTYARELIELAGGVNVFGDRPGASVCIEPEELVRAAPELCFVSWCGVDEAKLDPGNLVGRRGLEALPAARAGRVHALDERFTGRPGPRMLEAARRMAEVIERSGVRG
ncbi:helical backbone metal receptor [Paraliomyxa miuraensis]|uniref:helical backbone metal receptor n=1 Tax=Paraliomyxa miuraensis TaxID=376150 RepID=UPI0022593ECD|nr:helical backbone metal receptor [Paraliomyxa miuraensis]MCX4243414.1 helical backbone metal receptor [Paraliomyxa miuraensis]